MIDTLESLKLTQRSQSNAKEMSWNERGCFGSAQCAHKNVKGSREEAKSRPPSIYRCTPSKRVVIPKRGVNRRVCRHATDAASSVRRSRGRHVSCAVKFPMVIFPPADAYVATKAARPSLDKRGAVRSESSSTHQTRPSVVQRTCRAFDVATAREAADDTHDRR
jgi:hypothetical protein